MKKQVLSMILNLSEERDMDNIIIEKKWDDGELIEIMLFSNNDFINVHQDCYTSKDDFRDNAECILQYIANPQKERYLEYGRKAGNFTPAFSMLLLPIDVYGHMRIEMDVEVADNEVRAHRCSYYVNSELGLIEQFAHKMLALMNAEVGYRIKLIE